jgi:polysaccharide chain length determinant protein (PEP-CTERM system associated)
MHRISYGNEEGVGHDFVLDVWHRRKWVAFLTFMAAAAAAISATRALPDLYRSTATVLVEQQQVSEAFVRPSVTTELETRIQTIHQQVMSRARLADVITRLNLYPELRGRAPMDAIANRMRRDIGPLDLKAVDQTTGRTATIAFSIGYTSRDPEAVARVANTLVGFYVEENTRSRERQAARTAQFLKEQLAEVKRELDAQEQRTTQFRALHGTELPEQVAVNLATLERLNGKLRLNAEYQSRVMERRERLERQLAEAGSPSGPATPALTPAAAQLVKLKQDLADLRRQYSDQYPEVIRVKAEIAVLEQQIAEAAPTATGTIGAQTTPAGTDAQTVPADPGKPSQQGIAHVNAELQSLKDEETFLRQIIAGYEARLENAPKRELELQQLSSGYEVTKERYQTLAKRYEDAQLAENLEQGQNVGQFRVLDPAIPPNGPIAPNRMKLLILGLAAALGLAFGAVVAAEKLDTTFHTLDDLRAFVPAPVLATIREIRTETDMRRRLLRLVLITVLVIIGLALIVAGSHYVASGNEQIVRRMA